MKKIELTQGKVTQVDDEDYEWLNQWKWYAIKVHRTFYAVRYVNKDKLTIFMHRIILNISEKIKPDHKDRDGLNNQRNNLRVCTEQQNNFNRKGWLNCSSTYKGVTWDKNAKKWRPSITINNKKIHLGSFDSETKAARAYDVKAIELFGEFAYLNNI